MLLVPTLQALRLMLNLCTDFAQLNNITFHPRKSHCIKFCTNNTAVVQYPIYLQGARGSSYMVQSYNTLEKFTD